MAWVLFNMYSNGSVKENWDLGQPRPGSAPVLFYRSASSFYRSVAWTTGGTRTPPVLFLQGAGGWIQLIHTVKRLSPLSCSLHTCDFEVLRASSSFSTGCSVFITGLLISEISITICSSLFLQGGSLQIPVIFTDPLL